jgi:hypothetical protein
MPEPLQPRTAAASGTGAPRAGAAPGDEAAPPAAVSDSKSPRRASARGDSTRAVTARRNGARSRGPITPEGKTRASRNALRHGLTAERWVVLWDEDTTPFDGLLRAWRERFAPTCALEASLVRRLAEADWRLRRATRIELEIFSAYQHKDDDGANTLGLAMVRDGHGAGAFGSLMRYRSTAEREYHRLLGRLLERTERREQHDVAKRTQQHVDSERFTQSTDTVSTTEAPQVAS